MWILTYLFLLWKALVACLPAVSIPCWYLTAALISSQCQFSQPTCNTFKHVLLCILFTAFYFQGAYKWPKSYWQFSLKPLLKTFPSCSVYNRGSQFIMLPLLPLFVSSLISWFIKYKKYWPWYTPGSCSTMVMQIINTHVELRCQGELRYYEIDDIKVQFESTTIPDNNINLFSSYSREKTKWRWGVCIFKSSP